MIPRGARLLFVNLSVLVNILFIYFICLGICIPCIMENNYL